MLALLLSSIPFPFTAIKLPRSRKYIANILKIENRRIMPYEVNGLYHLDVRKTISVPQRAYLLMKLRDENYLFSDDIRLFLWGNSLISV